MTEPLEQSTKEGAKVENLTEKVVEPAPDIDKAGKEKEGALSEADQSKLSTVQSLLDEHDIGSPEELKTFVANLANLKDKIGDADLEELKANSQLLKRYQKSWQEAESKKLEENETPEETIARLKKEKGEEKEKRKADQQEREEERENKILLDSFNKRVVKSVKAQKDLPESYHGILSEFLGVGNEINDIDLNDKASINRITKAATKKIMEFEQTVINRYLKGKAKVVKMTSTTDETPPATKPVKNLNAARGIMKERLRKVFGK